MRRLLVTSCWGVEGRRRLGVMEEEEVQEPRGEIGGTRIAGVAAGVYTAAAESVRPHPRMRRGVALKIAGVGSSSERGGVSGRSCRGGACCPPAPA